AGVSCFMRHQGNSSRKGYPMNKLIWSALAILLFSMSLVFLTFLHGDGGYLESLIVSCTLSAPLIIAFSVVAMFCRTAVKENHKLLCKMATGVFVFTALLHVFWNSFMLLDVVHKGGLGPAQGYSGLIMWFGSMKVALLGAFSGIILHYISLWYKN
ncbi:hypothetical protein ACQKP8_27305, partial [Photobacterium alginatilyticum]|uniref:hypothetical protein n=1 Tax=Photobacterium alginatilyticum TaxID=1775171 RepID=UPI0040682B50